MGREVRKVPAYWEHPRNGNGHNRGPVPVEELGGCKVTHLIIKKGGKFWTGFRWSHKAAAKGYTLETLPDKIDEMLLSNDKEYYFDGHFSAEVLVHHSRGKNPSSHKHGENGSRQVPPDEQLTELVTTRITKRALKKRDRAARVARITPAALMRHAIARECKRILEGGEK